MQFIEFHDIIKKRISIDEAWYSEIEKCWKEMTALFSSDIDKTIQFLESCTAEEFTWISEVIEDVAKKTHSKEFIAALRQTATKYPNETQQYNILDFIESADCIVDHSQEEA